MNERKIAFADRLRQLRTERSLSQYQLAQALNVSRGLIGNYELGTREPDYETLAMLAEYFGVSADFILGLTDIRHRITASDYGLDSQFIANYMNLSPESKIDAQKYIALLILKDNNPQ